MHVTFSSDGEIVLHFEDSTIEVLRPPYRFILDATTDPARADIVTSEETFSDVEVKFERTKFVIEPVDYDLGQNEEPEPPPIIRSRIQRRRLPRRMPDLPEPLRSFFTQALKDAEAGKPKPDWRTKQYQLLNRLYRDFPEYAALITAENSQWFIRIKR